MSVNAALKCDAIENKVCNYYDHVICSNICSLTKVELRRASRSDFFDTLAISTNKFNRTLN